MTSRKTSFATALVLVSSFGLTGCDGTPGRAAGPAPRASSNPASTSLPVHPFARHDRGYAAGVVLPNQGSTAQLDQTAERFYDAWKAKYLTQGCGSDRYYVNVGLDGNGGGGRDPNSISISEGHGYGMLITALMAGYDPMAETYFDGLYRFYKDHPSMNAAHLMAWNQVKGCGNAPAGGSGSATDGDADIAYALLLADRQWGSGGAINYRQEAISVLGDMVAKEVSPATRLMLLDDSETPADPVHYNGTRSSDFFTEHFKTFAAVTGDPTWTKVGDATYALVATIQASYSPGTGLLPDFIQNTTTVAQPAGPNFLESPDDGHFAYNACRDPWRIGMDALLDGDPRAIAALGKLNTWVRAKASGDPSHLSQGYDLSGNALATGATAAFVAPLGVSAMIDSSNQAWLNAIWGWLANRQMGDEDYYGNTLKLLAMIAMSGNWWSPATP